MGENATSSPGDYLRSELTASKYRLQSVALGIAGIILMCAVMSGYIVLFRKRLKVERALLLLPIAAGLSWVLNAVRITVLLMIGAYVSPELAVGGFS